MQNIDPWVGIFTVNLLTIRYILHTVKHSGLLKVCLQTRMCNTRSVNIHMTAVNPPDIYDSTVSALRMSLLQKKEKGFGLREKVHDYIFIQVINVIIYGLAHQITMEYGRRLTWVQPFWLQESISLYIIIMA